MSASIKFTNSSTGRTVIRNFETNPKTGNVESTVKVFEGDKPIYEETFAAGSSSNETSKLKTYGRYAAKAVTSVAGGLAGLYAGAKIVAMGTALGATLGAGAGGVALAVAGVGLYAAFKSESTVGTALAAGVAAGSAGVLAAATGAGAESLASTFEFAGQVAGVLGLVGTVGTGIKLATAGWKLPDAISNAINGSKNVPDPITELTTKALDGAAPEYLIADNKAA